MEFTNRWSLPDWVAKGLTYSTYNRDNIRFDISATKLIDSPQIAGFWKSHGREVVEDASDRVWSAFGTAVHGVWEEANKSNPDVIFEKRFRSTYNDKVVAGQIDCYEIPTKTISDIKTCGSFKVTKGDYTQWANQLNVCAALMRNNGYEVEKLTVTAVIKDWNATKAKMDKSYPKMAIQIIDIPLWTAEAADDYIEERLKLHFGDEPKTCSDAERWIRPGKWAVHKVGGKRALRLLDSEDGAIKWAKSQLVDAPYEIVERPTSYIRCEGYCNFSQFCEQYKGSK
jgi:hypothetical protein